MAKKKLNKLDLVILVGGYGSRISKFTKKVPKPLLEINKRNFLSYLINHYSKYCFENIYLLAGYKGNMIKKIYHNKISNLIKIKCLIEKKKLGTAGALSQLKNKMKNDFVLMNGDSFIDVDLSPLFTSKFNKNFKFQMYLTENKNYKSNKKLSNLSLKKNSVGFGGKLMNTGIYFFKKSILNKNESSKYISLEDEILPDLIKHKKIKGQFIQSDFIDIGTYKSLKFAKNFFYKKFIKPAAFLDRDGVINHDFGYVHKLKDFKFKVGVIKGLKFLNKKNYNIFIVTNQAGIARGYYSENEFILFSRKIKEILFNKGCFINDLEYSPYLKGGKIKKFNKQSALRKPGNKMIENIKKKWPLKYKQSFMIGDQKKDELCAKKSNLYFEYNSKNFFTQIKKIFKNTNNYY